MFDQRECVAKPIQSVGHCALRRFQYQIIVFFVEHIFADTHGNASLKSEEIVSSPDQVFDLEKGQKKRRSRRWITLLKIVFWLGGCWCSSRKRNARQQILDDTPRSTRDNVALKDRSYIVSSSRVPTQNINASTARLLSAVLAFLLSDGVKVCIKLSLVLGLGSPRVDSLPIHAVHQLKISPSHELVDEAVMQRRIRLPPPRSFLAPQRTGKPSELSVISTLRSRL
ncbi:hypothetical protein SELMODRAFT_429813 [Selaginella moellendorffii]|uniref:Uncharacterized protein n=1 Tax=Selaginella moellendorffii TaxID=88036 RepID=D8T7D8_SELML|nr:hypothetical protein SELMODRAFT_429813 [Selaginella moellendorffii]